MPAPFLDTRLEVGIDFGATYGPRFNTAVTRQANGAEQRRALWSQPLVIAQLGQRSVTQSQLNYLIAFHASVQGAYSGFRLRDWSDFYAVNQVIGTGNGTSQTWQLVKRYSAAGETVTRPITKPVADSVVVYLDGVEQETGWSVDGATGVLTTALTGVITASFEFDVPVRFEQDRIEFTFKATGAVNLFELATVTCTEVRIEPTLFPALDPLPGELLETIALGYDLETQGGPEFSTQIAMTGAEFESRAALWTTALGQWNLGARTLNREQIDYFLAWFRVCRGQSVPFSFYDWQSEAIKKVRFSEDRISFTFQAYRRHDREAIFTLGGAALRELPAPTCTPKTLNFSDSLNTGFNYNLENLIYNGGPLCEIDYAWNSTGGFDGGGWVEMQVTYQNVTLSPDAGAFSYWINPSLVYVPTNSEEIVNLTFSAYVKNILDTSIAQINTFRLALKQSGNLYFSPVEIGGNPSSSINSWTLKTSSSFSLESTGASLIVGVPIYFGIYWYNAKLPDPDVDQRFLGIDNLAVSVNVSCP